ncbi:MAG TPA: beta galactosidase jelly roll domain-containing protein, partial [Gemmatimonadales bacterium]|nr:beta galactosidase jelly roll domain-containing protein [Gemmatimonadales bacterium]
MTARPAAFLLTLAALSLVAAPAAAQRERFAMDPGWQFTLGDPANAQQPSFDDRGWRRVDLPHDWSIEGVPTKDAPAGGRGGYFPTGIGWYRKAFRLPSGWRGHEVWLQFDGVYMNSDVWVNGHHVGHRPYGYVSFSYDVTNDVVPGINVVAVRVDNSEQPNSRWYSGSGIYRHVWLTVVDPVHVGHWGVYVTTPHVDSAGADVVVRTRVDNDRAMSRTLTLRSVVVDSGGHEVGRGDTTFALDPGTGIEVAQHIAVPSPMLWSTETPT